VNATFFGGPETGDTGFSLVELLVALLVLSVTALGLTKIALMTTSGNTQSKDAAAAMVLAADKIEELKNTGFARLSDHEGSDGPFDGGGNAGSGGPFTRSWQVETVTFEGLPGKEIVVQVSWSGGDEVRLSTVLVDVPEEVAGMPTAFVESWNQVK